jgi:hypothetical protein
MASEKFKYKGEEWYVGYGLEERTVDSDGNPWYLSVSYESVIQRLHPDKKWFFGFGGDYQGDWVAVGHKEREGWFAHYGSYGSCSGCDWLQGVSTIDEAIEFLKHHDVLMPIGQTWDEALSYLLKSKENGHSDLNDALDKVILNIQQDVRYVKRT